MVDDRPRTLTYCRAIEENADSFRNRVVLDVGSGSRILSLFAARAGARPVDAVECTPIYQVAEQIVRDNGYSEQIEIIHLRLEDSTLPEQVDIIISEWMGYSLFFERMLTSVLVARDRYLKPGGWILPSRAQVFIAAAEFSEYRDTTIDYWNHTYGFDFTAMKKLALAEPVVETCEPAQLLSGCHPIADLDLHTCPINAIESAGDFSLIVVRQDVLDAFVTWFAVTFGDMPNRFALSTSPHAEATHWKQTWFFLTHQVRVDVGDVITGRIEFRVHPTDEFGLLVKLEFRINDSSPTVEDYDFS
jgi:hypothetical protein